MLRKESVESNRRLGWTRRDQIETDGHDAQPNFDRPQEKSTRSNSTNKCRLKKPRKPQPTTGISSWEPEDPDLTVESCLESKPPKSAQTANHASAHNTLNEKTHVEFKDNLVAPIRGTHIPKWILEIVPNSTDAIVFAQIHYWLVRHGHNPRVHDELIYRWVAKTSGQLAEEICRGVTEIDKSLKRLKASGLIDWKIKLFSGRRHRHIWIDWRAVKTAQEKADNE